MLIPSFSNDTCLVLNKAAAIQQANIVNEYKSLKNRFDACMNREKTLTQLWENTKEQLNQSNKLLSIKQAEISIFETELDLHHKELERVKKQAKKQRLKSLLIGVGSGFVLGGIGGAVVLSK